MPSPNPQPRSRPRKRRRKQAAVTAGTRPALGRVTARWLAGLSAGVGVGLALAPAVHAEPRGGRVVSGQATVTQEGSHTQIDTSTYRTRMRWDSFDIATDESVHVQQPTSHSSLLNQVTDARVTNIDGSLTSNGQVWIVNPAGVYFGGNAVVDVSKLVAGAGDISNRAFMKGVQHFTNLRGEVRNDGVLHGADGVSLLGRAVSNNGQIVTQGGDLVMAAGDDIWVSRRDTHILTHMPDAGGVTTTPAVENTGVLDAGGGRARMAAGDLLGLAIRNSGEIHAHQIALEAGAGSIVDVSGTLDARNDAADALGGSIEVTGDWVNVHDAELDASGGAGGGRIHVGGEVFGGRGAGRGARKAKLRNARGTFVDDDSVIRADALADGDGGEVVVWSDEISRVSGVLSAQGGAQGGDGGFIETSSKGRLDLGADVNVGAPAGRPGAWLLDPANVAVVSQAEFDLGGDDVQVCPDNDQCQALSVFLTDGVFQPLEPPPDVPNPTPPPDTMPGESLVSADSIEKALLRGGNVVVTTQAIALNLTTDATGYIQVREPIEIESGFAVAPNTQSTLQLFAAGDVLIDEPIASDNPDLELSLDLFANDNDVSAGPGGQPENQDQLRYGDVIVNMPLRTMGGRLRATGTNVEIHADVDTTAADPDVDGGTVELQAEDLVATGLLKGLPDGQGDANQYGNVTVDGTLTTNGGGFTSGGEQFTQTDGHTIDAFRPDPEAGNSGFVQLFHSAEVWIGGDLRTEVVRLFAASSGLGDLFLGQDRTGAPTGSVLEANQIELNAGDGTPTVSNDADARIVIDASTHLQSPDDPTATPERFTFSQDANIVDADLPSAGQFGSGSVADMVYAITTNDGRLENADIELSTPEKVAGADLVLIAPDSIDVQAEINPKNVQLVLSQSFTVTPELAANLRPMGDPAEGDGFLRIHAGRSGQGNLRFADGVVLQAAQIALRAGDPDAQVPGDNGTGTTSEVFARGEGALTFQGLDDTYGSFEIRQDANLDDRNVPDAAQINGGDIDGLAYTLLSEGGQIDLDDPTKLARTYLTLTALNGITLNDPITADAPLSVRSADLGGFNGFIVGKDLLSQIDIEDDGGPRVLTLRAGTGNLSFQFNENIAPPGEPLDIVDVQVRVEAERIELQGATIDVATGTPLFQVDDGTSTERLILRYGGEVADSVLPTEANYPDGLGPSELFVVESPLRVSTVQDEGGWQFPVQGDVILASLDVSVARNDGFDLVLTDRDNLWGDSVALKSVFESQGTNPGPPIVGGRVDAANVGSIRGFDPTLDYTADGTVATLTPDTATSAFSIEQDEGFLLRTDPVNRLPDFDGAVDGDLAFQPDGYTLTSQTGSIEVDNGLLKDTNLLLQLGAPDDVVVDFDGSSALDVTSLVVRTNGELVFGADSFAPDGTALGDGANVVAENGIQLESGLDVPAPDPEDDNADVPLGNLRFADGVVLDTPVLVLRAGVGAGGSTEAVVDARNGSTPGNAPQFTGIESFVVSQGGSVVNGLGDGAEPPDTLLGLIPSPDQFADYVPGSDPLDSYEIETRVGDIEINDPSELLIARSVRLFAGSDTAPTTITLRADAPETTPTCETACATGNGPANLVLIGAGSDAESVYLRGRRILLEAPAPGGYVDAGDERVLFQLVGPDPVFAIRQDAPVLDTDGSRLPDTSQFVDGLAQTPYIVQSVNGISVGRELADRVAQSNLVLVAGLRDEDFEAALGGKRGFPPVADLDDPENVPPHAYDRFADRNGDGLVDESDRTLFDALPDVSVAIEDDVPDPNDPFVLRLRSLDIQSRAGDSAPIVLGSVMIQTEEDQTYRDEIRLTGTVDDPTVLEARAGILQLLSPTLTADASSITFEYAIDGTNASEQALVVNATDRIQFLKEIGATTRLARLQINLEQLLQLQDPPPTPRAEFGSVDTGGSFVVHADEVLLNPEAGDPDSRYARQRVPNAATFFRRGGSLEFDVASGGTFTMGENEKLSVDGSVLRIAAPGGTVTVGDLSALDLIDVDAATIHIQRRGGGPVLRANGRNEKDIGVDFVANQIDFHDGANAIPTATLVRDQVGHGKSARFGIADPYRAPAFMDAFSVVGLEFNILTAEGLDFGDRDLAIDGIPDGISRVALADTYADVRPRVAVAIPAVLRVRDPDALDAVDLRLRAPTSAELRAAAGGAATFRDLDSTTRDPGEVVVSEPRLVAREIEQTAALYRRVFGDDGSRAAYVRQTLQEAVDDYRRSTGARRIVGFELRRYVYNRPSSQFQAYQELQGLDALFRHHRRSGLTPTEYGLVQQAWLEAVKPEGITLRELSEFVYPSRYVRGSDVLDVFGD